MDKSYLTIDKIEAYTVSFKLSNYIWSVVMKWDNFSKNTIGRQLVRSADSISANIAEGFGRYHKKEKIHFYRYSFGSMEETIPIAIGMDPKSDFKEFIEQGRRRIY